VESGFAGESPGRGGDRQHRGAGDGKHDPGYGGTVRVVQREDTGGTVSLDRAAIVGVHEGADEERGEEGEHREQSERRSTKHSPMRLGTHHG